MLLKDSLTNLPFSHNTFCTDDRRTRTYLYSGVESDLSIAVERLDMQDNVDESAFVSFHHKQPLVVSCVYDHLAIICRFHDLTTRTQQDMVFR